MHYLGLDNLDYKVILGNFYGKRIFWSRMAVSQHRYDSNCTPAELYNDAFSYQPVDKKVVQGATSVKNDKATHEIIIKPKH